MVVAMASGEERNLIRRWLATLGLVGLSAAITGAVFLVARPYLPNLPGSHPAGAPLASFQFAADGDSRPGFTAPDSATAEFVTVSKGETPVVRLAGMQSNAPATGRPGIYLSLPEAFEKAASGQIVRVTLAARRSPDSPNAAFAVDYSTSDVGNSGWQRFPLTDDLTIQSFTFAVPPMNAGNGDFIGILPDPVNSVGSVEIAWITAEVFPQGTPLEALPPVAATATSLPQP
jgi:hypothetical protein